MSAEVCLLFSLLPFPLLLTKLSSTVLLSPWLPTIQCPPLLLLPLLVPIFWFNILLIVAYTILPKFHSFLNHFPIPLTPPPSLFSLLFSHMPVLGFSHIRKTIRSYFPAFQNGINDQAREKGEGRREKGEVRRAGCKTT